MGRVEVFQPIPSPDGKSPEGPHTHVLPRLLAHGRLNAATVPVPDGWLAGLDDTSFLEWEQRKHERLLTAA